MTSIYVNLGQYCADFNTSDQALTSNRKQVVTWYQNSLTPVKKINDPVCFAIKGNDMYITSSGNNRLLRIKDAFTGNAIPPSESSVSVYVSGNSGEASTINLSGTFLNPKQIVFDNLRGQLYVACKGNRQQIFKINPDARDSNPINLMKSAVVPLASTDLNGPFGVSFLNNDMLISDEATNTILKSSNYQRNSPTWTVWVTSAATADASTSETRLSASGLNTPGLLKIRNSASYLISGDNQGLDIVYFDSVNAGSLYISKYFDLGNLTINGFLFDGPNALYVSTRDNRILKCEIRSASGGSDIRSNIQTTEIARGSPLNDPGDLIIVGNHMYVMNKGDGKIIQIRNFASSS